MWEQLSFFDEVPQLIQDGSDCLVRGCFNRAEGFWRRISVLHPDHVFLSDALRTCQYWIERLPNGEWQTEGDLPLVLDAWRQFEGFLVSGEIRSRGNAIFSHMKHHYFLNMLHLDSVKPEERRRLIDAGTFPHDLFIEIGQLQQAWQELEPLVPDGPDFTLSVNLLLTATDVLHRLHKTNEARHFLFRAFLHDPLAAGEHRVIDEELTAAVDALNLDDEDPEAAIHLIPFVGLVDHLFVPPWPSDLFLPVLERLIRDRREDIPGLSVRGKNCHLFSLLAWQATVRKRNGFNYLEIRREMKELEPELFEYYLSKL